MEYRYEPKGVCSMEMIINVEGNIIKSVEIVGGCPGNTVGVSNLVKGMSIDEAIARLKGIPCGGKGTSCPDQLAIALEKIKEEYGLNYELVEKQTDTTDLMEGIYIKVENEEEVIDRFKYVRSSFLNTILDSETHWVKRPIIPNRLKEGINIFDSMYKE